MLRTALSSIAAQTAVARIAAVLVSENGVNLESEEICAEFPNLPIHYFFHDPSLTVFEHYLALFESIKTPTSPYIAILNDDDWWGINHVANAVNRLEKHPDAVAYWASSYHVRGESSWITHCWNMAAWVAVGFPSLTEVVKLDRKQAALACVGGGPAHCSSLVARVEPFLAAANSVAATANLLDGGRIFFLELASRGPLLLNLVPEVFIRQHPAQGPLSLASEESNGHLAAATRRVLEFCKEAGIDVVREFSRLYEECPVAFKPYLFGMFDRKVLAELRRQNVLPLQLSQRRPANLRWLLEQLCPPFLRGTVARLRQSIRPSGGATSVMFTPPGIDPTLILPNQ